MWEKMNSLKRKRIPTPVFSCFFFVFFCFILIHKLLPPDDTLHSLCILPMITFCNDPLKRDQQSTTVPRRATQSCEILSVWGLLLQITCPLDVFGLEWRTVYATQQAQQCVNVSRIWFARCETDWGEAGAREECVCLHACVWEYMCRGGIRWSLSQSHNWGDIQYNETTGLTPYSLIVSRLHTTDKSWALRAGEGGVSLSMEGSHV